MKKTDNYFWQVQTTWYIQDNTSANWFLILCKINNLEYQIVPEEFFYRIEVEGKTDNLLKLKSDWDFRKSINDPLNPADYLIANQDASKDLSNCDSIIVPESSFNGKIRIVENYLMN